MNPLFKLLLTLAVLAALSAAVSTRNVSSLILGAFYLAAVIGAVLAVLTYRQERRR